MDHTFRFILEEPNAGPSKGQNNRKRARLVTACDNCRVKKIKCIRSQQTTTEATCEACRVANSDCSYGDRDRYQTERGLSFASPLLSNQIMQTSGYGEETQSKKRKASSASSPPYPYEKEASLDSILPGLRTGDTSQTPTPPLQPNSAASSTTMAQRIPPPPIQTHNVAANTSSEDGLRRITVPFFRYFGPTANTPGYRRVKVRTLTVTDLGSPRSSPSDSILSATIESDSSSHRQLDSRQFNPPEPSSSHPQLFTGKVSSPTLVSPLFDSQRSRYPSPVHLPHLAGLFFDHLACHFPFLHRHEVMRAVEDETFPAILANCLAALACRFSDRPELLKPKRHTAGEPYLDTAKLLVVHMLSWPSLEVLQALVLISWSEFGSGRDSGLWMYSRMAVAMAMDLGLHVEATVQLAATESEREKVRYTWWSVVMIDRINSWGTGRPIAIADDQFDTALPLEGMNAPDDVRNAPHPSLVFGHLASLVQLRGKMGDVLNNLVKRQSGMVECLELELTQLQYEMTNWYQTLSPSLAFTIQNFRRFVAHNQSSIFLLLHCMFHSVITLLHRPSLLQSFTPDVALPLANSIDVSRSSARSLVDMVSFADEIESDALVANPFLDLPILTAARAFLEEREFLAKPPANMSPTSVMLMRQWSETSLDRCKEALKKMARFWGGVGCVKMILDQQSAGDLDFNVNEGNSGESHVAYIRDVELITTWATSQWRRHVVSDDEKGEPSKDSISNEATAAANNQMGGMAPNPGQQANFMTSSTNGNPQATYFHESPAGASVGITGFLDGSFGSHGILGNGLGAHDDGGLRVSFNSAEADLSFPNLNSTEFFSIPEGFEEFLGNTMLLDHAGNGRQDSSAELRAAASSILNGTPPVGNGKVDAQYNPMPFPAFSTLIGPWFPMGQFQSRAPSPGPL